MCLAILRAPAATRSDGETPDPQKQQAQSEHGDGDARTECASLPARSHEVHDSHRGEVAPEHGDHCALGGNAGVHDDDKDRDEPPGQVRQADLDLLKQRSVDLAGVQTAAGKTFSKWNTKADGSVRIWGIRLSYVPNGYGLTPITPTRCR